MNDEEVPPPGSTASPYPRQRPQWRPAPPRSIGGYARHAVGTNALLAAAFERDLARRWHAGTEHAARGLALGLAGCDCIALGGRLHDLVLGLSAELVAEPPGLGAVVVNPLTGGVWVRGSHPDLPWQGPEQSPQDWSDPTSERRFEWADLAGPLLVMAKGWKPPSGGGAPAAPVPRPPSVQSGSAVTPADEASAEAPPVIGTVVRDPEGRMWIRLSTREDAWWQLDEFGDAGIVGPSARWDQLEEPLTPVEWWSPPTTDADPDGIR